MRRTTLFLLGVLLSSPSSPAAAPPRPRVDFLGDPLPSGAVARFGTTRLRFASIVPPSRFTNDGKYLITPVEGKLRYWDVKTGKHVRDVGFDNVVLTLDRSSDEKRGLGWARSRHIVVIDLTTGEIIRWIPKPDTVQRFSLSSDGKTVAVGHRNGSIQLFSVDEDKPPRKLEGHSYCIDQLAFSPDSRQLASAESIDESTRNPESNKLPHSVRVWDVATGKQQREFPNVIGGVVQLFWLPDGESLIFKKRLAQIHSVTTGKLVAEVGSQNEAYGGCCISPDGKHLALSSSGTMELWDHRANKLVRAVTGVGSSFDRSSFSPDGRFLAWPSRDERSIRFIDTKTGKVLSVPPGERDPIRYFDLSPDGRSIATTGDDSIIRTWDMRTGNLLREFHGSTGARIRLGYSPDGETIVTVSDRRGYRFPRAEGSAETAIWRVSHGELLWRKPRYDTRHWFYLADNKTLALGRPANTSNLQYFDARSGNELPVPKLLQASGDTCAITSDGTLLASVEVKGEFNRKEYGPIQIIDLKHEKVIATLPYANVEEPGIGFLPGSRFLVVSDRLGGLQFWDAGRGKEVHDFTLGNVGDEGLDRRLTHIDFPSFSPDGRLATTTRHSDPTPRVWEVATGKPVLAFPPLEAQRMIQAKFDFTGQRIVTLGEDATLLCWDIRECPDVPKPELGSLSEVELTRLWQLLTKPTAEGFRAGLTLSHRPEQAVALIARYLQAAPKRDVKRITTLITQLDSEDVSVRERASRELQDIGRVAEPELQAAVDKPSFAEVARRARAILASFQNPIAAPAELRAVRAIGVLEWIGSSRAREVLAEIARGEPLARQTQAAAAAQTRLRGT